MRQDSDAFFVRKFAYSQSVFGTSRIRPAPGFAGVLSKVILTDMAGMFSPKEGEAETPVSPFKVEMEVPPVAFPAKKQQSGKDRRDDQRRQGQARRKKVVNPVRIRRPARPNAEPIPEEDSSKRRRRP